MKRVLFVCTQNAGRSQMAESFFNHDAPTDIRPGRKVKTTGLKGFLDPYRRFREC